MLNLLHSQTRCQAGKPTASRSWSVWTLGIALATALPACSAMKSPGMSEKANSFEATPVAERSGTSVSKKLVPGARRGASRTPTVTSGIQQVDYQVPANPVYAPPVPGAQPVPGVPPFQHQFVPAQDRLPASPFDTTADDGRTSIALQYPDEYLFDGGDRDYPVHYDALGRAGVETEDTFAEFRDEKGRFRVKPTNRVAIYAPRFASVTTISQVAEDFSVGRLADNTSSSRNSSFRTRVTPSLQNKPEKLGAIVERVRGSEIKDRLRLLDSQNETRLAGNVHTLYPETYGHFVRTGEIRNADEAQLAEAMQSAISMTRAQNPQIVAKHESAGDIKSIFRDTELVGLKENPLAAGRLRIVKLADTHVAKSGDVITFTIRFDNQGHQPLSDLVITDNLTPRLQYVPDSATSDRAGRLVTEENGEGSLILRWELEAPLEGRTGGVVTFQARVK